MAKTSQELVDLIDEKIEALISSPEVSYKIGDKSVSASDKIKQLKDMRASLLLNPDADMKVVEFDGFSLDEMGIVK